MDEIAVSTPTLTSYDWIKKIPTSLVELDDIPLLGNPPPFPWEKFLAKLSENLEIQEIKAKPSEFQWREENGLFSGMGDPVIPLNFAMSPLEGKLFWAMADEDIHLLMSLLLLKEGAPLDIFDQEYQAAFYQFLGLEAIYTMRSIDFDNSLTPQLIKNAELPSEAMLCMDVSFSFQGKTAVGRLFISPQLRQSIKKYYTSQADEMILIPPLSQKLEVIVPIEAGKTTLTQQEWASIKPGDFVLLDQCSLKEEGEKGRVILTLHGHPFFRGKIKEGNIEILEHPLYHEANQPMNSKAPEEEEEGEEDEEEENEEGEEEEEEGEEEEDEDEEGEEEEDEEEDEDEGDEEEEEEEEKEEELKKPKTRLVSEEEKVSTKPQDIPLPVVIEVGRLQMSIQTLMDLKPGNILELNLHPESGVDLVVNGSRIGKGELLQIGETLGVRILSIG